MSTDKLIVEAVVTNTSYTRQTCSPFSVEFISLYSFLKVSKYLFFFYHSYSGVCLGHRLQAADGSGAGSEALPRLQRKRWLSGHHSGLLPPSTPHSPAQPDAALHRLSGQSRLPRPRSSGGNCQPNHQLYWSKRKKYRVPVWIGWCCEDNSARGPRPSPVFFRKLSEK